MVKHATALLLTLALPGLAAAQVEEISPPTASPAPPPAAPPQVAPPEAPPALPAPPPVRLTRYSRYRTAWYLGFGLGGGGGWVSDDSGYQSESEGGVAVQLKAGWVARPWMLVGVEISAWRHDEDRYWVQFSHYDVVATFFPIFDNGFYGKAGLGAGVTMLGDIDVVGGTSIEGRTEAGVDVKLGLGYEWQLFSSLNLGGELCYSVTAYDEGRTHDLTAQLTLTWY